MLGRIIGKVTGKSVEVITSTPTFVTNTTKSTMEALKNAKDNFVTEFKSEIEKSEPIELPEI